MVVFAQYHDLIENYIKMPSIIACVASCIELETLLWMSSDQTVCRPGKMYTKYSLF